MSQPSEQPARKCIECGSEVHPIEVVIKDSPTSRYRHLEFAPGEVSAWRRFLGLPIQGDLTAEACGKCGRVTFRIPVQRDSEQSEKPPEN